MADISDVEQAIADAVSGILYPIGTSGGSIIGATCRIYRGWPNSGTLNADLADDILNVTVASDNDSGSVTTRYLPEWTFTTSTPSFSAAADDNMIVIGGQPAIGSAVGVLIDGRSFVYRTVEGDTIYQVASNLCAEIQAVRRATLHGTTVVVPGSYRIIARVVADAGAAYEERRQDKDIRVIFWCPSPDTRDAVAAAVDLSLSQVPFLRLLDGSSARIVYKNSLTYDQSQNARLYRRDLLFKVEYPTIVSIDLPTMLFGGAGINGLTELG